jgi:hypothetical protein
MRAQINVKSLSYVILLHTNSVHDQPKTTGCLSTESYKNISEYVRRGSLREFCFA